MRRGLGTEEDKVVENDVDDTSDQTPGELGSIEGEAVVGVGGAIDEVIPVPADSGKSLVALIATWLGGILLSYFVSKGWMTTALSEQFAPAITVAVVGGVSYVTARFLKSRSDVKVEALKAHASVVNSRALASHNAAPLGAAGPLGGFGGFSLQGVLGMLATANTMVNFLPLDSKTKGVVRKSINAAIAAITAYQKGE